MCGCLKVREIVMVLNDLSLSTELSTAEIKAALENELKNYLPEGSFSVILRSYNNDVRNRQSKKVNFTTMIVLKPEGRKAALENKDGLEAAGFQVTKSGDVSVN